MGWLSGYQYRKKIPIVGTTAGAQASYQKKLLIYRYPSEQFCYYNGRNETETYAIGVAICPSCDYGFAKYENNPILTKGPGAYDAFALKDPFVIKIGDKYVMYYSGYTVGIIQSISIAESDDGLHFTKYASNPVLVHGDPGDWDQGHVAFPVVYDTEVVGPKRYRMLFCGGTSGEAVGRQIGYAYSADGYSWTKGASNPVVPRGDPGTWEDDKVDTCSTIVKVGGTYYFLYSGRDGTNRRIGLVTFTDFEGAYTKSPSNPVIDVRNSAIQTLTAQTDSGTKIVTVGDTSVFEVNEPVFLWTGVGKNHEFNRIVSIDSGTQLTLEANAVRNYAIGATIRSWMYAALVPRNLKYEDGTFKLLFTAFGAISTAYGYTETTAYATSSDLISWTIDYEHSPPVPYLGDPSSAEWDATSAENAIVCTVTHVGSDGEVNLEGHALNFPNDIRFTKADGETPLDYWKEDPTIAMEFPNSLTAWIEFQDIPLNTDSDESIDFYIYYGKVGAASGSDGDATFPFFDHFLGVTLDAEKWDKNGSPTVVVASSIVTLTSPDYGFRSITSKITYGKPRRWRARGSLTIGVAKYDAFGISDDGTPSGETSCFYGVNACNRSSGVPTLTLHGGTTDTFYIWEINWKTGEAKFYREDILKATHTTNVPSAAGYVSLAVADAFNIEPKLDWVFVSARADPEPTWGVWGSEEEVEVEVATPTVTTNPATEVGQTTATLNGTLADDGGEACDCGFEYGETTNYGSTTPTQSKETDETFSQAVLGLRPGGIVYHFRAIATNSVDTSYGADRTFHTEALSAEAHQALGKGYALGRAGL